jgi:3-dehydroquinate synthase
MRRIEVDLGARAYPILIGSGLLRSPDLLRPVLGARALVVTNEVVAPLYLDALVSGLRSAGVDAPSVILPDGERHKDWPTLNLIFDALLGARCERSTPLVALGGGVIGDMTGFAAACYQRGVPFVQIPTTLLAQVDSSVGGKTAINHPLGKNMIGAFYQPRLVLIDSDTLRTLPDRELSAGLAEVVKYGLIRDAEFFAWLEVHADSLLARDDAVIQEAIERSCRHKAEVVIRDETEQGERATLNLGHTFGHAIETGMGYGTWLHGEAVAAGTMMAAALSVRLGWLAGSDLERIEFLYRRLGLPVEGPAALGDETYLDIMAHDKKVVDGALRLVLLRGIGQAVVSGGVDPRLVRAAIADRRPAPPALP